MEKPQGTGQGWGKALIRHRLQAIALGLAVLPPFVVGTAPGWLNSVRAADLNEQLTVRLNNGTYGRSRNIADSLLRVGKAQERNGLLQNAVDSWQQALKIYQDIGDREAETQTYGYLTFAYARLGQYPAFEDALRRWLANARDRQDFQTQIYALNSLGRALHPRGGTAGAEELFADAVAISNSIRSLDGQAVSYESIGLLAFSTGNYERAVEAFQTALLASRKAGDTIAQATTLNHLGDVYRTTGYYGESMRYYALAFRLADMNRDRPNQYRAIDGMVTAYNAAGSYQQSVRMLNQRLGIARTQADLRQELASLRALAKVYQQAGDDPQAVAAYERAIAIARMLQDFEQEAILTQGLIRLTEHGNR